MEVEGVEEFEGEEGVAELLTPDNLVLVARYAGELPPPEEAQARRV